MVDRGENSKGDEAKYAQIPVESILTWAEATGISYLSQDVARSLASDSTYRIRQVLHVCKQFIRHNNRQRLTADDVNRALKWMDVPSVFGYSGSDPVEWTPIPDIGVHVTQDTHVNLASAALSGDIFHQPGNPCVRAEWIYVAGHNLVKGEGGLGGERVPAPHPLTPDYAQYYQALFRALASPSEEMFKVICEDISTSPRLGPVVGAIVGGVVRGVQRARQKPVILRRILLVIRSLLTNPQIHVGPQNYMKDLVTVLVYCVVTERKSAHDTQMVRSLAGNILLQVSQQQWRHLTSYELVLSSLHGVLSNGTRNLGQHVGALSALITLGSAGVRRTVLPLAAPYMGRLRTILTYHGTSQKDRMEANMAAGLLLIGMVNVTASLIRSLPNTLCVNLPPMTTENFIPENDQERLALYNIYLLGAELFGSAFVLPLPRVYLALASARVPRFSEENVTVPVTSDELLSPPWKKRRYRPPFRSKGMGQSGLQMSTLRGDAHLAFEDRSPPLTFQRRPIYVRVRSWPTKLPDHLHRRRPSVPTVVPHIHRALYVKYVRARSVGPMPENGYHRTMPRMPKQGYALDFLFL